MRIPIYTLSAVLLLCVAAPLAAQNYYTFSVSSGTYTDLDNATPFVDQPDTLGYGLTVPFSIEEFGTPLDFEQDTVGVFSSGFIGIVSRIDGRICSFDGFVAQMTGRDNTSSISYRLDGDEGEKVLKLQWKNMGMVGNASGDFANFQLWLNQKDNSFEVHVGPNHVTGRSAYYSYTGPAIGGFAANSNFSTYYGTYHLIGNPTSPQVDRVNGYYPLGSTPAEGTIYHFTYMKPASVAGPDKPATRATFVPNPVRDAARIELPAALNGKNPTVILYDLLGREVLRNANVSSGDYISTSTLRSGVYRATLQDNGQVFDAGSIVVAK